MSKNKLKTADTISEFAENILNAVREPLLVLDKELKVIKANHSFFDFFKVTSNETIGTLIYDLGNSQWNIPKLKELLETILPEKTTFDNYEVEYNFPTIGKRIMLLNARQIERAFGKEKIILLAIEDITERKLSEKLVSETNQENIEYLDILFNHTYAPIIIWDASFIITNINHAFENLSGYDSIELKDKKIDILFPKDKANSTLDLIKESLLSDERPEIIEVDLLTKDKDIKRVLWNPANVLDKKGQNIVATIAQDITKRKQTEEALTILETRYRRLFESAKDGIIIMNADTGKIIDVNPFLIELLGFSKEQLIEKQIWDLGFFKDIAANKDRFLELQKNEYVRYEDLPLETANGRKINVEFVSNVYLINNNKVIQCNVRDITERKKMEVNFSSATELAKLGYWEYYVDSGNFIFNDPYYRIIHGSSTEKQGGNIMSAEEFARRLVHPDDSNLVGKALQAAIQSSYPDYFGKSEARVLRDNGDVANVSVQFKPMKDRSGRTYKIIGVNQDITEEIRAQHELIQAKEKAEEMNRLKSNFLANMSHELRTPLIGILGYAEFLESDLKDEELLQMVKIIKTSGQRLNKTLNNILDISKVESDTRQIHLKEQDLLIYLSEQIKLYKSEAEEKGLLLKFDTREEILNAYIDKDLFISIINNLLNNAIKYTKTGGITLTAKRDENNAVIVVRDTGIGVPKKLFETIFEPFRQASEGLSRKYEGTGLGLTLAKKYADLMGGTINMESNQEDLITGQAGGSTFILKLPLNDKNTEDLINTNWS
ncbi:MAG: sensor histidine kinase [Ignavibacteriaceae bacterium]